MKYTEKDTQKIIKEFAPEWSRRSKADMIVAHGKGCFIWDAEEHARIGKAGLSYTGMFYTHAMLPNHFPPEMAKGLQGFIDHADHNSEVVVALIFDGKAHGHVVKKV